MSKQSPTPAQQPNELDSTAEQTAAIIRLRRLLKAAWLTWLALTLLLMPVLMSLVVETGDVLSLALWQLFKAIPMLLATPYILRGNRPYALIVISFVVMLYAAIVATQLFIHWYQGAAFVLRGVYLFELVTLLEILVLEFLLLKKLPKMNGGQT